MKEQPRISVIMPNFNCEKYIEQAIESILNQSFHDFELIIVDDASTDQSRQKMQSYLSDDRVKLIELKSNQGNYHARNIGIDASRGEYIAVMDADDVADVDRLAIQYKYISNNNIACVGSQGYFMGQDKTSTVFNVPTDLITLKVALLRYNFTIHSSLIYSKNILELTNQHKYDETYPIASDYDFVVRCARHFSIVNLPERLIHYRLHPNQISETKREHQINASRSIRRSQIYWLGLEPSDIEMHLFNCLMEEIPLHRSDLESGLKVLNSIIEVNEEKKYYSQELLHSLFKATFTKALAISRNIYGE